MKYMKFKAFGFKNEKKTTKEFILFVNMCREEKKCLQNTSIAVLRVPG